MPEAYPPYLPKEEVEKLPLRSYEGPITLVTDDQELSLALDSLESQPLFGFDIETKPAFRKGQSYPPALLQLAGENEVHLIQLQNILDYRRLADLLASPDIIKTGVGIHDDIKKLQELFPFDPGGFVELSPIAQSLGIERPGIRNLVATLLHFRISKKSQVSNWARPKLTDAQIHYAATDAWVSREIYFKLREASEK